MSEGKLKDTGSGLKDLGKLYRFLKPYVWLFILGMFCLLMSTGASLMFPKLLGDMVDLGTKGRMMEEITRTGLILMAILVAQALFGYTRTRLFVVVTEKTLASIRQHIYDHLIKLPMSFFSARRVGELNSRISSDIALLQDTLTYTLADLISQVIVIIGGITLMAISSFQLTLFTLAIVPAISLLAFFSGRAIRRYSKKAQAFVAESNTIVEETLQGIQNVKAFTNEAFESDRYRAKTEEVARREISGCHIIYCTGILHFHGSCDMAGSYHDCQRTDGSGTALFIRNLFGVHRGEYCRHGRCIHTAAEDTGCLGEAVAAA